MTPEPISLTSQISYIKASEQPLSADVGIIKGACYTWLFDVGNSEEVATFLQNLPGEKILVLSHFHPDHIANWKQISHRELYQGANTYGYTKSGMVVERERPIEDGLSFHLVPLPSSHAKGSLLLEVEEYAFLGDATYCTRKKVPVEKSKEAVVKPVYNAQLLKEEIQVLKGLRARYVLLSHDTVFCHEKKEIIEELEQIYARRKKESPYIR